MLIEVFKSVYLNPLHLRKAPYVWIWIHIIMNQPFCIPQLIFGVYPNLL